MSTAAMLRQRKIDSFGAKVDPIAVDMTYMENVCPTPFAHDIFTISAL